VDSINTFGPAIAHITGNATSRFFSITNYDASGNSIDLLVNTTDAYDGVRPLDFLDGQHTARFEVKAEDTWTIEIKPLAAARRLDAPGTIQGVGDDVIIVMGGNADLAKVKGNTASHYFGVFSYGDFGRDTLVNTTDPYDGTDILRSSTFLVMEIIAVGDWAMEITTK
jgi:hypothetical protein